MLGYEMIGEGRTTKVYRDGNRALKLYVNAPPDEAYNEAKKQIFAVRAGLPVPEVYGVKQLEEGVALEMQYINGVEIVRPGMDKNQRRIAFESFVCLQCLVHRVETEELPKLAHKLAWKIEHAPVLGTTKIDALLNQLQLLDSDKKSLCHGDFHVSNVLVSGDKLWIIDWVDAACGDPLADACRTYLLLRQYISRMAGIYLRLFCKASSVQQEEVLKWLPIVAAGRLHENINRQEMTFLLNLLHDNHLTLCKNDLDLPNT